MSMYSDYWQRKRLNGGNRKNSTAAFILILIFIITVIFIVHPR